MPVPFVLGASQEPVWMLSLPWAGGTIRLDEPDNSS